MSDLRFSDCVKQRNGDLLCWDKEVKSFMRVTLKAVRIDECEPCAIEALIQKIAAGGEHDA